jgi:transcriptional regulator with XRE-family HTH domain
MTGIGERLKLARRMARLSQQALADRAGVSKMAISKYEHNQMMPGSEVMLRLAQACCGQRQNWKSNPSIGRTAG